MAHRTIAAAIGLMYPPLLAPLGVSGFILNGAGAAIGIGMWLTRGRGDPTPLVDRSAQV